MRKNIKLKEKMNGKLGKTKDFEENVGKMRKVQEGNSGKNRRNARKGLKKRHDMEARQKLWKS